jgi:hypothetical protein
MLYKNELKLKIFSYLLLHSCIDCGESDVVCLDFDHINPDEKYKNISDMVKENYSWDEIKKEINKCCIRCSNCHRKRTAKDNGWFKLVEDEYAENPEFVYEE